MRGSLPFACTLSLKQKTLSQLDPFHSDLYNDHLAKNRRVKRIGRGLWPQRSLLKVTTIDTEHQPMTNLMTPGQYSTMHQVTIPKESTTIQSVTSVEQDLTSGAKCKQTAVFPKLLSDDNNVPPPQVPTQERICFEIDNTPKECTVAADTLPSSCSINPSNIPGWAELKEISKTKLKGQRFMIASEESLLYENMDEEMSSDLDSSLEGKLLIDESMSDEEVNNDGAKEREMAKQEAQLVPQIDKPASSSMPDKKINTNLKTDILKRTNIASEIAPKLCSQKFPKDLDVPTKIGSSNIEKGEDCTAAEANEKEDVIKESHLKKMNESQIGSQNLSTMGRLGIVQDAQSTNSEITNQTETVFVNKDEKTLSDLEEGKLKANAQPSKLGKLNMEKFFNQSDSVVFKEAIKNRSVVFNGAADMPPKVAPNKDDLKDKAIEQACETEHFDQSILKDGATESCRTPVQPSASPDSTTYTGEELSPKAVPCRKVSFVLIEDCFVCVSCSKRFTIESVFKRHVWHHFHHCVSGKQLCIHCSSNKDSSQCPAVKKVFTMLHNSCSKEVSSLRLNLLRDTPSKETSTNQAVSPENTVTNNPNPLPKFIPTQPERRTSERTDSSLKSHSQNIEHVTVFISSQQFVCTKCYKRIIPFHLAQHIYRHLHASATLPKHGICISEKECDIMGKIFPMIPSPEVRKAGFFILGISWKWTVQIDLIFQIMLVRHNPKNGSSRNSNGSSKKEDLQMVKFSNFFIPNRTKENSVPAESNANARDVDIEVIECKQVSADNVIVLDSYPGEKVTPPSAKMQEGYKKLTFVIKCGHYICTSCTKGYVNLDLLKAHIMWHFHSYEKLCSISHYDGQLLQEKECPILTNIMSCIPELDREMKMVIVYWKKNTEEKTAFKVQIVYPKKNPVIDLTNENSDDEDTAKLKQSMEDALKEGMVIDIDDNSLDSYRGRNKEAASCLESSKTQEKGWKEKKAKLLTETKTGLKPDQEEIAESELKDISLAATNSQASQPFENVKTENVKNSSLKSEGGFYICGFSSCKFSCIESNQFRNHLEKLHSSEKTFPCIHCGHSANSQELLMKHMDTHANHTVFLLYHCSMCEYATNLLPDFEQHLWSDHSKNSSYLCRYCKECFSSIDLLLKHLTKNLLKFILCPHCSARDVYRRRMLNHIQVQHPDKPRKIVVTSQLICKTLNQNKLIESETKLKDIKARTPKCKDKVNILIILDEEEDGDTSKEKEKMTTKCKDVPQGLTERETKVASHCSQRSSLLHNILSNVETKPTPNVDCGLTSGIKSEMDTKSKNGKASSKHRDANVKEKKNDDVVIILDDDENDTKNNNNVKCSSDEGEVRKGKPKDPLPPVLIEILSNRETKRVSTDNGLRRSVETSSEVETKVQKSKSSSEKRGVEDEKRKKSSKEHYTVKDSKEHYTVKDSSKLPCELKIMLRRTSYTKEISDTKNMSPNQAAASPNQAAGKERNVFQLFGEMEKADVQGSPLNMESSGGEAQIPSAESQNASKENNSALGGADRDDSENNDCPYTEDDLGKKIKTPSLLQEISLGGATLDLHLQKCYSKSGPPNPGKHLVCSLCLKIYKTVYRMHLHLLSDHFKWPLWECQDCGIRVYSHSKITTHCWRIHKNQSPRIKSLDLPVIGLDKNNEFMLVNTQEEFAGSVRTPLLAGSGKKNSKSTTSMSSKSKRDKSSAGVSASSVETPEHSATSSRKRSKSMNSDKKGHKKKKSSVSESASETTHPSSTSSVGKSASGGGSVAIASVVIPNKDSLGDGEQPPKKKSKSSNPDRNEKKCSMCDFSCSSKSDLYLLQHMIQEHMKENQNLISDEEIEQVEEAITGNPLLGFVCPFCSQNTKQRVDCKIHIWRTHARLKLLDCSQCKFVTWFEHHMQRHMAEDHGDRQASVSTKNKETPVIGVTDSNCLLVTSSAVSSTPGSQIQQEGNAEKTTGQMKPLQCSQYKYITLFEQDLKAHWEKQHPKKIVNGIKKTNETGTGCKKSPPKAKSSSNSRSQLQKEMSNSKKQKPPKTSNNSTKTSMKSEKPKKTPPGSVPLKKASTSDEITSKGKTSSKSLDKSKSSSKKCSEKDSPKICSEKDSSKKCSEKDSPKICSEKDSSKKCSEKDSSKKCSEKDSSKKCSEKDSSKKCSEKDSSRKWSDKSSKKSSDKDKNSEDKKAASKSTEINKTPTVVLKKILPKPPFPLEKSSVTKSSKPNKSPKKTGAAVGGGSAEESKTNSTSLYIKSDCPKTGRKLYTCSICSVVRDSVSDVINHWKKHRDVLYQCSMCAYKKHNRDRVFEHIKLEHRNEGRVLSTSGNSRKGKSKLQEKEKKKKLFGPSVQ